MGAEENVRIMREVFSAIERRDSQRFLDLCDPNVEFHWPPSLPYGGVTHGHDYERPSWSKTWFPLQPTEAEKRMDPIFKVERFPQTNRAGRTLNLAALGRKE